jgi:phosphoribosylaminoimidazolecarboxamide formyltransferase/IMP cyclohydrolase
MDIKIRNAIFSVSNKTGLVELAKSLTEMDVRIFSTGGTAKALENVSIPVIKIADYTGFPEILDGRVKSLHPKIHGGILAKRDNENHMIQLQENGISAFDLVVINLYPFEKVITKKDVSIGEAVENIDIGGPSLLRSAAKNYRFVCVVPDPCYYDSLLEELKTRGGVSFETRKKLAMVVFEKTAYYDSIIAGYFHTAILEKEGEKYPDMVSVYFMKKQQLRYGENPHQSAAFYTNPNIHVTGVSTAHKLHGKELSFNNILDIEAAAEIVKEFDDPACSIIKHTNPCGAACADALQYAFIAAWNSDPVSAFGSIIGLNRNVDTTTAGEIVKSGFVECIIAPGYEEGALNILKEKKNVRILETGKMRKNEVYDYDMKRVVGGILVQERDRQDLGIEQLKVVTEKEPSEDELRSLLFAWKIVKHVKSNAIVLAQGTKTVGIGAGQMSRVDATHMAIYKAKDRAKGAILASDAFFPKPDALQLAADCGITAVIQPGGSVSDDEVIEECNNAGISMVFTGVRHFKH